ncbi:hypothetical protein SKAU_G00014770 [Synaphobranchus kaupii]|uniref:Uncharacterized protein n=1 Tax=Synaphobranchus kaupii TaxID=118154 RepID=A0A9Q1JDU9_SYNKA|nr:hypothetical protein SKAU_G00014770 [Synaphobranchus kaupii]
MEEQGAAVLQRPGPAGGTGFAFHWFLCAQWVPKFSGGEGTMKFGEWKVQVQAMLRAQALTEDQQVDFVLGALEGTAQRKVRLLGVDAVWKDLDEWWQEKEPGEDEENVVLLRLEDRPIKQELQRQFRHQDSLTFRQISTPFLIVGTREGGPYAMSVGE